VPASEHLKKAVLYAKSECGLKPCFQAMDDEEIIYYLDHMADTDGESINSAKDEESERSKCIRDNRQVLSDDR